MFSNVAPASPPAFVDRFFSEQKCTHSTSSCLRTLIFRSHPRPQLLNFTMPCRGNRAPATICRLSVEVLHLCKEIDCFYEGDKRELSPVTLPSFKQLHGGKEGEHSALN